MGPIASTRQLLRSLCHHTPWKYAVFWKLKHRRMLLAWEEGYCENSKSPASVNVQRDVLFGGSQPYGCETDADCKVSAGNAIQLAVDNMACHLYSLGNGIVGTVAFTGKHRWVLATEYNSKSLPEHPEEWQCQLAAGVKTIVLVPVLPRGVVQLGSLDLVAEDLTVVAHIKDLFNSTHDNTRSCTSFISAGDVSPLKVPHLKKLSPSAGISETYSEYDQSQENDFVGPDVGQLDEENQFNSVYNPPLPFTNLDSIPFSKTGMQCILGMGMDLPFDECSWEAMYNTISVPSPDSHYRDELCGIGNSFMLDSKTSSSTPENTIFRSSENHHAGLFSEISTFFDSSNIERNCERDGSCCLQDEMDKFIDNEALEVTNQEINDSASNFPKKCDIHESFGEDLLNENSDFLVDSPLGDFFLSNAETFGIEDFSLGSSSDMELNELWTNAVEVERLLESIIADLYDGTDGNLPNTARCARSSSSSDSSENCLGSCLTQNKCEPDLLDADHLNNENHKKRGFPSSDDAFASSPTSSSSKDSSMLMNEEKPERGMKSEICQMKMPTHAGKRKPKAGDTHKPRPRDRQLIQDRVKELRELVPNAAKCSIDALLDRTIKHMLFLRSVSSQAEKLKKCALVKADPAGNQDGFSPPGHYKGTAWAYELGNQPEPCPIIVENLGQQGHMLVEMLCTEYGDFLEIAQVMRRLDLTILKGVMESREEKLWARFVVEGSKGFNRMEILWPLMQLLQQNRISLTTRF